MAQVKESLKDGIRMTWKGDCPDKFIGEAHVR